ncbi:MAG: flagellar motor switch protein FliM [Pseudomonadota bacterium]
MGEILTQNEVDSLLSGLSAGKIEAESDVPVDTGSITSYDFASQERVIRGRMPTFEVINERFAREMRVSISNVLHTTVDIAAESMETLKFSEFGRSLPVPTSLHVFRMEPLRGYVLLVLESELVYNLIDTFFGGQGLGKTKIEGREFTAIEDVMIKKVVAACLKDLETAWGPVEPIQTVYVRAEVNPQFATIAPPTDLVIVSKFEVELEQSSGTISLCLPYAMIEPIRNKLIAGFQSDALEIDHAWRRRLTTIILSSEIEMRVELGKAEITGERLINLKVGDIIQLDTDAEQTLSAYVSGLAKLRGYAGIQRGFQALRVEDRLGRE